MTRAANIASAVALAGTVVIAATAVRAAIPPTQPTLSYTADQAYAGRQQYTQSCAECHGGGLQGVYGPALAGPNARNQYESPSFVYGYYRVFMPSGKAGSLSKEQYVSIMAFILQQHGVPVGKKPLTETAILHDTAAIGG